MVGVVVVGGVAIQWHMRIRVGTTSCSSSSKHTTIIRSYPFTLSVGRFCLNVMAFGVETATCGEARGFVSSESGTKYYYANIYATIPTCVNSQLMLLQQHMLL